MSLLQGDCSPNWDVLILAIMTYNTEYNVVVSQIHGWYDRHSTVGRKEGKTNKVNVKYHDTIIIIIIIIIFSCFLGLDGFYESLAKNLSYTRLSFFYGGYGSFASWQCLIEKQSCSIYVWYIDALLYREIY